MLALLSAAAPAFRAPLARRVFVGSSSATGRSKVLSGLQPRSRPVAMAESFVDDEVELGPPVNQKVVAKRFVEADVGMTFPKTALHDKLFEREWPEKYPFPPEAFRRQDEQDDSDFYSMPRLVYHIDEGAVRSLTNYYKENIAAGSSVLDICSSWVSHYPADFPETMERISGTGMNALELQANRQLSDFEPKNLNIEPKLPYADESFDVVTCVVSVDYLIHPLDVFKEARRVLRPGGKFILSQSNRCFPTKAIAMWLGMSDLQHCLVIGAYFHYSGGWSPARAYDVSPTGPNTNDPFFIVEATKE
jgi:hypothetical protein